MIRSVSGPDLASILADLTAEHDDLDRILGPLDAAAWNAPTPAEGWAVRDQVGHLAYFDREAVGALTEPDAFTAGLAEIVADPEGWMAGTVHEGRTLAPPDLLALWRERHAALVDAARAVDPKARIPWYGPPMSTISFLSARLMETWVHGQDVVDALGVRRTPTARLRHVAHIAVRARAFNYAQQGRPMPEGELRVELAAPDGETWAWGPEGATARVSGDAEEFCLVTTQRRHIADTDLRVEGALAEDWMPIAQAFAGPPGSGRRPGQFPKRGSVAR
jgi:uncharacterized protein (TIGR03084 family)